MATSVLLKRSLLVIWIPPIFSLLLTARVFLLMATFANRETAWVLALGASFGVSLVPALVWWASMESIWMWRGPRIRTHCAAIVVSGGLLGAVLAFLVSLLLQVSRFRFREAGGYSAIGCFCGVLLGLLIFPRSRLSRQRAGASPSIPPRKLSLLQSAMVVMAAIIGSGVVLLAGFATARWYAGHLPSDEYARREFNRHRDAYRRIVALLEKDRGAKYIGPEGDENPEPFHPGRIVPEYRQFLKNVGANEIMVRDDGAIEFELWGSGGAIVSDSYKGMRYQKEGSTRKQSGGWTPTAVRSLDDAKLPHENGRVATGLYIVPIERDWSIYRFEYQE